MLKTLTSKMEQQKEKTTGRKIKLSSEEIAKRVFSPDSKLRTTLLLEKALKSAKSEPSSSEDASDNPANPNDSLDFKDAPKLRKTRLKLKLKHSSNLDKEDTCSLRENEASLEKVQKIKPSSDSNDLMVKKDNGRDRLALSSCSTSENIDQRPIDYDAGSKSKDLCTSNSNAQTVEASLGTAGIPCCVCGRCVPSSEHEEHLRLCLRERFTKQSGTVPCTTNKEETQCNICHEDIGHLNSRAQTKHVNSCLDKSEAQKQKEVEHKELLVQARKAVLACPLCAQNFKSQRSRKGHLKKCAKDKSMTVEQLKLLMKQQEEEYAAKLDAGILPEEFKGKKKASNSATRDKRKQVRNIALDEQTQIALALSNSLMTDDNRPDENFVQSVMPAGSKNSGDLLEGPSGLPALLQDDRGKTTAKGRKGKQTESNNYLLTVSREQAAERISSRVNNHIFNAANKPGEWKTPPFKTDSRLSGSVRLLSLLASTENSSQTISGASSEPGNVLWSKTSHSESNPEQDRLEMLSGPAVQPAAKRSLMKYYVSDLMPPISPSVVPAGSKVRRVSAIPGRRKSGTPSSKRTAGLSVGVTVNACLIASRYGRGGVVIHSVRLRRKHCFVLFYFLNAGV
ncbi:hypothetical protein EGW08_017204, partial [Elysia chlorotica]